MFWLFSASSVLNLGFNLSKKYDSGLVTAFINTRQYFTEAVTDRFKKGVKKLKPRAGSKSHSCHIWKHSSYKQHSFPLEHCSVPGWKPEYIHMASGNRGIIGREQSKFPEL